MGFCAFVSCVREEFTSSTSLITMPPAESVETLLPFANVWLWAGCLVRLINPLTQFLFQKGLCIFLAVGKNARSFSAYFLQEPIVSAPSSRT